MQINIFVARVIATYIECSKLATYEVPTYVHNCSKFGVCKIFTVFEKKVSYAQEGCIYLIKNTEKNSKIVKYYDHLK